MSNLGRLGFGVANSHQGKNDDCYTPPEIFHAMNIEFEMDVCAPVGGLPWIPARKFLSELDDGLTAEWHGSVWMNPPFSKPLPWVQRFIEHGDGIALVPTSNGKWMDLLWNSDASWSLVHKPRFIRPDGTQHERPLPTRIWLVAFGDRHVEAIGRVSRCRR